MALRQIVQIGEPVLRKKSKKVEKIDEKIIQLLDDMAETMYDADGVGLAAPQVG
ncbi:MAG: peptide deformylase, partial [Clostridioides difficile]|nr:peptide deformylase [Clostridioides difficile]